MMLKHVLVLGVFLLGSSAALSGNASTLKAAFKGDFVVGAAINADQITGVDARSQAIVTSQFSTITPENDMKWEHVHPNPGVYDFSVPDKYVALGLKNHMYIVGHTLLWHNQTPDWVFHDDKGNLLTREALLERLREHIHTVVGRYKGKINDWDVVNEVIDEDGSMRQSLWYKIIGDDYIAKAFEYAHEADPQAGLNYNDYNIEQPAKRAGALALVKRLKDAGVPITTVGIQGHYGIDDPNTSVIDEAITEYAKLGVKVAITELDIDVLPRATKEQTADVSLHIEQNPALNPYAKGLPADMQQKLAQRYADLFSVFLKHKDVINRVTLWGVTDSESWLNNWPVRGRTSYPLLFDRNGKPKAAFKSVMATAGQQIHNKKK